MTMTSFFGVESLLRQIFGQRFFSKKRINMRRNYLVINSSLNVSKYLNFFFTFLYIKQLNITFPASKGHFISKGFLKLAFVFFCKSSYSYKFFTTIFTQHAGLPLEKPNSEKTHRSWRPCKYSSLLFFIHIHIFGILLWLCISLFSITFC